MSGSSSSSSQQPTKKDLDPTIDFLAGTVAGLTSKSDFKTREQLHAIARPQMHSIPSYKRKEHVDCSKASRPPWQLGCAILNGLVFGTYGFLMKAQLQAHQREPSLTQTFIAGAGSGVVSSLVTCPSELIKIHQQGSVHSQPPSYEAVSRSFRRRVPPPTDHSTHKSGALAREAHVELPAVPWYGVLLAGALAGPASWIATFPADVIKTRMQALPDEMEASRTLPKPGQSSITAVRREMGTLETVRHCYRREGLRTFVAGLTPTLIRSVPVNIVTFGAFEFVVSVLTKDNV
ncbi:related to carnitine/acyl carnitine carrier, putative-Cryptococcus neoformans [Serendipita indica DSM 11827]|uniref:Related to carnitine/acyl carnitine carrier, putative-Cryptococcus neoformans n=1 Tax=Serendipita indica (strain DSM 11827) TaxID=1109443 RepID=G4THF4_SERID|nr:related to carnitine/acyl carnitine carrier, putative-Cryptococcus neoformans [Serendipita indica DSM 11827]